MLAAAKAEDYDLAARLRDELLTLQSECEFPSRYPVYALLAPVHLIAVTRRVVLEQNRDNQMTNIGPFVQL